MATTRVYLCGKRGCGKRKERTALAEALGASADDAGDRLEVVVVGCQSVCDGPVAGVVVDGRLEWFRRLRSPKARRRLAALARRGRGPLPGALAKRRRPKRAGRLRGRKLTA